MRCELLLALKTWQHHHNVGARTVALATWSYRSSNSNVSQMKTGPSFSGSWIESSEQITESCRTNA